MPAKRALLLFVLLVAAAALPGTARAQGEISISIDKHARLTADGGVIFRVLVTCGPLPGTEDFREGVAGAEQASNTVGDDQICAQAGTQGRMVISGPLVR